ncbi:MAG: PKD domain-containing protein [Candidatus Competibacteraceae bacterium]|nr:PKD domain-containing protein [Candidatus Competibacteraceae bacterium]
MTFANSSTGNVTGWLWNFGDGTTSADKNPSKAYSNAGTYTVSLTATGPGGSNTATKTGYISVSKPTTPAPSASFNATPTSGVASLVVTLIDTSTGIIASRLWDLGDGTTSTTPKVSKTYSAAGTYAVKLTVTNASGSTTTTKTISVTAIAPVANFSATPTSGTAPLKVEFSDSSTNATSWSWNFGDGNTSTLQNPSNTYLKAGTFTASLIASGPGGASTVKTVTITVKADNTVLPAPWLQKDIGTVNLAGSAGYTNGAYTIKGAGTDIWGKSDSFHFVYQSLTGDGTIVARVSGLTNTNAWAKSGVMIRESLDSNARHAMVALTPSYGVAFQRRAVTAGLSAHTAGTVAAKAPYWVKLVRSGNVFTAYQSANGTTWTKVGSATINMITNVYVGLALTSHNATVLNTTTLNNVVITRN